MTKHAAIAALMTDTPKLSEALAVLRGAGHTAHLVGGAIRNVLAGLPAKDFDIATSAEPLVVTAAFEAAGWQVVHTGIEHGTVTAVGGSEAFEITTWRRDVATDGRRATVAFATSLDEDAQRRDFTINALYASADGTVLDPTGTGLADLEAGTVRFIGNAEERIREDALRILRFFRFSARFGSIDTASCDYQACTRLSGAVAQLSAERIGQEMRSILALPAPAPILRLMAEAGVLAQVFAGQTLDADAICRELDALAHLESAQDAGPSFLRRLALISDFSAREALVLSRVETRVFSKLLKSLDRTHDRPLSGAEAGYTHGSDLGLDMLLIAAARQGTGLSAAEIDDLEKGAASPMPLKASQLPQGLAGYEIGQALGRATAAWIASRFAATPQTLLEAARAA